MLTYHQTNFSEIWGIFCYKITTIMFRHSVCRWSTPNSARPLGWRVLKTPTSETPVSGWGGVGVGGGGGGGGGGGWGGGGGGGGGVGGGGGGGTWPSSSFNTSGPDPLGFDWEGVVVPPLKSLGTDSLNAMSRHNLDFESKTCFLVIYCL